MYSTVRLVFILVQDQFSARPVNVLHETFPHVNHWKNGYSLSRLPPRDMQNTASGIYNTVYDELLHRFLISQNSYNKICLALAAEKMGAAWVPSV